MEDDRYASVSFHPPLWRQRRSFILETLWKYKVTSVLDYGCGEASVLSFLIPQSKDDVAIVKLAGLDICEQVLQQAVERCEPWDQDYIDLRVNPLTIEIFHGSVDQFDERLLGYDAIVCSEVIEHLPPHVLRNFLSITLGHYAPRILLVTTPNAEYNVHFDALNYGKPNAVFRHDDHKFEWTRKEFQEWCRTGAQLYNYDTTFYGIGLMDCHKDSVPASGHCTQACLFIRRSDHPPPRTPLRGMAHRLLKRIEFPYYNKPPLPESEILKEIETYLAAICRTDIDDTTSIQQRTMEWCTDWSNIDEELLASPVIKSSKLYTRVPQRFPVSILWDILRIRQICQTKERMIHLLTAHPKYYQLDDDDLVVYKAFEVFSDATQSSSSCEDEDQD